MILTGLNIILQSIIAGGGYGAGDDVGSPVDVGADLGDSGTGHQVDNGSEKVGDIDYLCLVLEEGCRAIILLTFRLI